VAGLQHEAADSIARLGRPVWPLAEHHPGIPPSGTYPPRRTRVGRFGPLAPQPLQAQRASRNRNPLGVCRTDIGYPVLRGAAKRRYKPQTGSPSPPNLRLDRRPPHPGNAVHPVVPPVQETGTSRKRALPSAPLMSLRLSPTWILYVHVAAGLSRRRPCRRCKKVQYPAERFAGPDQSWPGPPTSAGCCLGRRIRAARLLSTARSVSGPTGWPRGDP